MNKKTYKRQRDLKTKLMAAVCMLLVSSLMMITSTYAWFTLSTAPEVTGITTAVGANGNLEMALQPYSGDLNAIVSGESDSLKLPLERNITWGNLVDVSDNASYGMNNLVLYPAKLNVSEGVIGEQPLATPTYGADGRVSGVTANTLTGAFDPIKGQFSEKMTYNGVSYGASAATVAKGVRAIGVSSSMTARELAYRNAYAAAINNASGANTDAGKSLNNNGVAIANIAIKHALDANATFNETEIAPLKAAVNDLDAIADRIETALKNYLLVNSIAPASAENTYVDLVNNITAAADLAAAEQVQGAIVPTAEAYVNAKAKLATMRTAIETASAINGLGDGTTWTQLQGPLSALVDTDKITVNGLEMSEILADGGKDRLVNQIIADKFIAKLTITTGGGVYADIADFAGNYSASFTISVSYSSLNDVPVDAEMYINTTLASTYLDDVKAATPEFVAAQGASASQPITTFYGYILDLAFRTNASGSYLQLQAEAIDRIYDEEGNNPDTMGHGASMTFKTDSTTFGQASVKGLMESIRVVFFNTSTREIIAYAKLDSTKASNSDAGITMPLMLTESDFRTAKADNKIMELKQNEAQALSVMVYLDGTSIGNDDVAADVANSMYGSMNLQFSSSADLQPMDYADLMAEGGSTTTSISPLNNVSVPNGYRVQAYTDGSKIAFALTPPADTSLTAATISVKIGDGTPIVATAGSMGTMSGYVVTIPENVPVNSNTAITITVEGATNGGTEVIETTTPAETTEATESN